MRFLLGRPCMRLMLAAVALCTLAVPTAAHAYCRTTTQQLPPNYSPSRGCFTQGLFLFWRNACVSYSINQAGSRNIPYEEAKRVIDDAFGTWMRAECADGNPPGIAVSNIGAATCGEVRYNGDSPNQNVIVFRDDGWPYSDPNSTLGLTTVTFNADTGEIYDADMEINSSARNLSTSDQVPANGFDLASVITHEAGHFFGLAHATDARSTMFASYKPGTAALRTLAPDDVAGLCAIYPDPSIRVVSSAVSANQTIVADACDPNPRHGFTAECSTPKREEKCAATPRPTASWAASGSVGLAIAGVFVARRRRARRPR
ncbi:MAG: matrixin family metalloprotease [Labilithrix sp.]|nr:matrixin family metalloprotease [Labilithrix sp.]MBX3224211.1 matrixin family metalloprotease [Labilithrix sp.]